MGTMRSIRSNGSIPTLERVKREESNHSIGSQSQTSSGQVKSRSILFWVIQQLLILVMSYLNVNRVNYLELIFSNLKLNSLIIFHCYMNIWYVNQKYFLYKYVYIPKYCFQILVLQFKRFILNGQLNIIFVVWWTYKIIPLLYSI